MKNQENNKTVISIHNLKKSYQMGKVSVPALRGITYDFLEGFTVIAGPSGSGKSTLLNIIGCLDKPNEGQVFFNGDSLTDFKEKDLSRLRRTKIGFIFQSFSLIPVLSVFDNVEYPILKSGISVKERRDRVRIMLESVGLKGYLKRFPRELSGGQMQRVAIARALISHPKLIIADEPTANLDSKTGKNIIQLLEQMQKDHGASIIIASHDENVLKHVNRQVFIKDGLIDATKN